MSFQKRLSRFTIIKGTGYSPELWEGGVESIKSNGLFATINSRLYVIAPCKQWLLCDKISVTNTNCDNSIIHKTEAKVVYQCDALGLCILALKGLDTDMSVESYSTSKRKLSEGGNIAYSASMINKGFVVTKEDCKYLGPCFDKVRQDLYRRDSRLALGDSIFKGKKFVGMVTNIAENYVIVTPREYIDVVVDNFKAKVTGLPDLGLEYESHSKKMSISKHQAIKTLDGYEIIQGIVTSICGRGVVVNDREVVLVYDERYKHSYPLGMWLQINCDVGEYVDLVVNGKVFSCELQKLEVNDTVFMYDSAKPKRRDYVRTLGGHTIIMPYKNVLATLRDTGMGIRLIPKTSYSFVPFIAHSESIDNEKGDDLFCYQIDMVNDKYVRTLDDIDAVENPKTIRYFDGSSLVTTDL